TGRPLPRILMKELLATATRPLGELLQEQGLLSAEDLQNALALQRERRDKLGRILIDLGYIAERDVLRVLSQQLKTPLYEGEFPAVPIESTKLPFRFLRASRILPVHFEDGVLSIVTADPLDTDTLT